MGNKIKDLIVRIVPPLMWYIVIVALIYITTYNLLHFALQPSDKKIIGFVILCSLVTFLCSMFFIAIIATMLSITKMFLKKHYRIHTNKGNYYYTFEDDYLTCYKKTFFGYIYYHQYKISTFDSINIKKFIDVIYSIIQKEEVEEIEKNKKKRLKNLAIEEMKNYGKSN